MRVTVRRRIGTVALLVGVALGIPRNGRIATVEAQSLTQTPAVASQGGTLPGPLPLFPSDNWWNIDITNAPVDPNSTNFINHIGGGTAVHPDLGNIDPDNPPDGIYGIPYVVVDSTQPKKTVQFDFADESDGVDHNNNDTSFPFYPIPDEAITQAHWIEGGQPGNQDPGGDRHMLIVDKDNKYLYELYALRWDGAQWTAGSGAFYDMKTNNRRPEGWTSADAAGLAILPGLIRYDEVHGAAVIGHALRMTVSNSNGHVYPASHTAGGAAGALPMGARLRLKPGKTISGASATPEMQRIVTALKKYGLIVADNGSNMFITGTYNPGWDNDPINAALGQLHASDFEVIQLGYNPHPPIVVTGVGTPTSDSTATLNATVNPNGAATDGSYQYGLTNGYGSTSSVTSVPAGNGTVALSIGVSGLACNTLHHFRAVATNSGGTTNGLDATFTTAACPPPPDAVTTPVTSVTQTGATLHGTVDPKGVAANRRFQYGLTNAYGLTSPDASIGSGVGGVLVSFVATGLSCNTQYHYRAVGQNSGGTTNGDDFTFTTAACPAPGSANISPAAARSIAMNSTAGDTLDTVRTEIWYKIQLYANRSYQFSAWTVGEDGAPGVTPITVDLFSDAAGTVLATPSPTVVSTDLEGSPNSVAMFAQTSTFLPTASGTYRIRVLGAPDAASTAVNLMLRETTLFSPWFFVTTSSQYDGFHEIHNNTSQPVQVTLRAFGPTGAQVGVTHAFTLPANATVAKSSKADLMVTGNGASGGTVLTHNGAFGAISANTTTLSGLTGLSFDSPFTSRSLPGVGRPIR